MVTKIKAIKRVLSMDHIKSKDLARWLNYVEMTEKEFDRIADFFRDDRVWSWDNKKGFYKDNLQLY